MKANTKRRNKKKTKKKKTLLIQPRQFNINHRITCTTGREQCPLVVMLFFVGSGPAVSRVGSERVLLANNAVTN